MGTNLIKYIGVLIIITSLGCVSTAKLTDFPASIDFDKYSKELKRSKTPFWTLKSSSEYYFERPAQISEDELVEIIVKSLLAKGYRIQAKDKINKRIIGKRGIRPNEWNSITGVYYKITNSTVHVYLSTKITQDVTGGWRENRAEKIGVLIEQLLGQLLGKKIATIY